MFFLFQILYEPNSTRKRQLGQPIVKIIIQTSSPCWQAAGVVETMDDRMRPVCEVMRQDVFVTSGVDWAYHTEIWHRAPPPEVVNQHRLPPFGCGQFCIIVCTEHVVSSFLECCHRCIILSPCRLPGVWTTDLHQQQCVL